VNIDYCSKELQKGAEWLNIQLSDLIKKYESKELRNDDIYYNNDLYYYAEGFFVLYKLGYPIANEYLRIINEKDDFGSSVIFDDIHTLYYLIKLGVNVTDNFVRV
jgi:hypothetical protein